MEIKVTPEQIEMLEKGAKSIAQTAATGVNHLTTEAINLFILQSCLHVLKFASVFIVFYMVKRYLLFLHSAGLSEKTYRAVSLTTMILSLTFFTSQSFPHLMNITEAVVAPNIFLLKKGAEFYKNDVGGK